MHLALGTRDGRSMLVCTKRIEEERPKELAACTFTFIRHAASYYQIRTMQRIAGTPFPSASMVLPKQVHNRMFVLRQPVGRKVVHHGLME